MSDPRVCCICWDEENLATICSASSEHVACLTCHNKHLTTRNVFGVLDPKCPLCRAPPINRDGTALRSVMGMNPQGRGPPAELIAHVMRPRAPPAPRRCGVCRQEGHTRRHCPENTPEMREAWSARQHLSSNNRRLREARQSPDWHGPRTEIHQRAHMRRIEEERMAETRADPAWQGPLTRPETLAEEYHRSYAQRARLQQEQDQHQNSWAGHLQREQEQQGGHLHSANEFMRERNDTLDNITAQMNIITADLARITHALTHQHD